VSAIDTRAALAMPGVVRVLVAADMPRVHADLDKISVPPLATRFLPMQTDDIVHEGQPVAIVLGESLEAAEAAAAAVGVTYERAAFIVPETGPAVPADPMRGSYSMSNALEFSKGDASAAIAVAPVKASAAYTQPSRHPNPMEPSATVAVWNGARLTLYDAVQHLPAVQNALAAAFGLPATQVRVIAPHTGGGFGAKAFIWPHEILAAMAAKVVRRPVKLVLTRQHMYGMVGPQPQMVHDVRLGAGTDGKLLGISHVVTNITSVTEDYVEFGAVPGRSFYACDNITTGHRVRRGNVTLPTFMRSPWDGPGSWALGSAMDELARALNMDPLDLRLINYADTDPESGKPWSSKKLREAYEEGARRFGWRTRAKGGTCDGHWRIGCGMADCSQGQARFHLTARVRLKADGMGQIESSSATSAPVPRRFSRRSRQRIWGSTLSRSWRSRATPIYPTRVRPTGRAPRSVRAPPSSKLHSGCEPRSRSSQAGRPRRSPCGMARPFTGTSPAAFGRFSARPECRSSCPMAPLTFRAAHPSTWAHQSFRLAYSVRSSSRSASIRNSVCCACAERPASTALGGSSTRGQRAPR
jgi:xanthine dehydrogenase YagR molybdenum-binding subunit